VLAAPPGQLLHSLDGIEFGTVETEKTGAVEFAGLKAKPKASIAQAHRAKYPTPLRGACRRRGSLISGGIHRRQREPYDWHLLILIPVDTD
jgi:hypothetical protein